MEWEAIEKQKQKFMDMARKEKVEVLMFCDEFRRKRKPRNGYY